MTITSYTQLQHYHNVRIILKREIACYRERERERERGKGRERERDIASYRKPLEKNV